MHEPWLHRVPPQTRGPWRRRFVCAGDALQAILYRLDLSVPDTRELAAFAVLLRQSKARVPISDAAAVEPEKEGRR